ncbi:hypothetical protein Misp01_32010 [Microtetraspora sp. NBRC 13810]|uniref:hypothetical protein n=1 Tax=Microtetraspora sp. NBRC 13810 TaxID=3030990 RepID=UPI0024A05557|nr:hypothetical protein [Microtetraspora sp. NBRC 13810]GLW08071.1 hypothetical protein Misp01_32010 [Microtetraspora sp. NBRC 13810]
MDDQSSASGLALVGARPMPGLSPSLDRHVTTLDGSAGYYKRLIQDGGRLLHGDAERGPAADAARAYTAAEPVEQAGAMASVTSIAGAVVGAFKDFYNWVKSNWEALGIGALAGQAFLLTPAGRPYLLRIRGMLARIKGYLDAGSRSFGKLFQSLSDKLAADSPARAAVTRDFGEAVRLADAGRKALPVRERLLASVEGDIRVYGKVADNAARETGFDDFYRRFGLRDHPLLTDTQRAHMERHARALDELRPLRDVDGDLYRADQLARYAQKTATENRLRSGYIDDFRSGLDSPGTKQTELDERLIDARRRLNGNPTYYEFPDGTWAMISHPGDARRFGRLPTAPEGSVNPYR